VSELTDLYINHWLL